MKDALLGGKECKAGVVGGGCGRCRRSGAGGDINADLCCAADIPESLGFEERGVVAVIAKCAEEMVED